MGRNLNGLGGLDRSGCVELVELLDCSLTPEKPLTAYIFFKIYGCMGYGALEPCPYPYGRGYSAPHPKTPIYFNICEPATSKRSTKNSIRSVIDKGLQEYSHA